MKQTRISILITLIITIFIINNGYGQEKNRQEKDMYFGLYAKLVAKPGQRDSVANILQCNLDELKSAGCLIYIINFDADNPDVIWVTEVWDSAKSHKASLELPSVKKAISEAMPLLTGEFEQIELSVAGGLGLPN